MFGISESRLTWGYYLGVFVLPFFILGFWQVCQELKPAGKWRSVPIFLINTFVIIIGAVTHGQTALLALAVQVQDEVSGEGQAVLAAMFEQFTFYYNPTLLSLRVLTLVTTVWFIVAVLSKRTLYPRWMAFFSPWVLLIVLMVPGLSAHRLVDILFLRRSTSPTQSSSVFQQCCCGRNSSTITWPITTCSAAPPCGGAAVDLNPLK